MPGFDKGFIAGGVALVLLEATDSLPVDEIAKAICQIVIAAATLAKIYIDFKRKRKE